MLEIHLHLKCRPSQVPVPMPHATELFYSLAEARIVIEGWRQHYNMLRPHSSLGYKPPAPEVVLWPMIPAEPAPPAVAPKPTMH